MSKAIQKALDKKGMGSGMNKIKKTLGSFMKERENYDHLKGEHSKK